MGMYVLIRFGIVGFCCMVGISLVVFRLVYGCWGGFKFVVCD